MDCAAVLTNDTDLMEPLRIAVEEFGIHLILLSPSNLPAVSLQRYANSVRHIQSHLGGCLLSNPVVKADGTTIQKPLGW